ESRGQEPVVQPLVGRERSRRGGEFRREAEGLHTERPRPEEHLQHEEVEVQERHDGCRDLGDDSHAFSFRPVTSGDGSRLFGGSPQKEGKAMPIKKILIVDDSATDRQFLIETLGKQGYQCVTANSGDEGIAKAKSELPDLILMDIIMPGTDG